MKRASGLRIKDRPAATTGQIGSAAERIKNEPAPPPLDPVALLALYEKMVLLRRFETAAQIACRKGETPGFLHLYIGEEATAVGVCAHLRQSDWITSTHRGHGHALAKGMSPDTLMAELFGKAAGCCGGRGGTMHLYDRSIGLFGTNGIVAAGIGHAAGVGISAQIRKTDGVGVAFFGDGAVNHGGFHEAINFAAVQKAAAVFVCENNLYATATPLASATLNTDIASKAAAFGIPGVAVDGNDVLAVHEAMRVAVERARRGDGPTLIEARTYRTVGHHEGDPVVGNYRTQAEIDAWVRRDPIKMFRERLTDEYAVATAAELDTIEERVEETVQGALTFARQAAEPDAATIRTHMYAEPLNPPEALPPPPPPNSAVAEFGSLVAQVGQARLEWRSPSPAPRGRITSWLDAVRDGIAEEMRRDPHIMYFGEGTGERGGTFAHTKGLWLEFGPKRMVDTPISEQGFTGAALGASATGARTIADLMFADFMFEAAGQIILQAAKLRYMSNGQMNAPLVIRVGSGAVRSAGPHHSGTYHPVWAHIPGLIVCMPATPADAKGLMKTALRAADPVIMLETKALFASKGEVPEGDHFVPFGVARIARSGKDLTIASAGQLVHRALEAAELLAAEGIDCEVIDLRTIMPLDVDTVAESVRKTHRLLVVDEGYAMCGVGAELGQAMNELAFDELDAPVARLHTEPVVHPLAPALERAVLVDTGKIVEAARNVVAGRPAVPWHWRNNTGAAPAVSAPAPQATVAKPESPATAEPLDGEPITMPFGDLTISEGKVVRWTKAEGDMVAAGELVAEIETDKAVVEIEAPVAGILGRIVAPEGAMVKMGGQIGTVCPSR
jgi:2-oxoisovalerate dehydrogenase E1 component